jgi:hypothetical protein
MTDMRCELCDEFVGWGRCVLLIGGDAFVDWDSGKSGVYTHQNEKRRQDISGRHIGRGTGPGAQLDRKDQSITCSEVSDYTWLMP